jgi:Na+-transporting NADH:ubiquinone oxidoreductase subunit NqrD
MNAPLTDAILGAMPPERSGVASALLNASREVAGLLGITVIGAVLRARQGAALRGGANPVTAFMDGYHAGLIVTIALMLVGVVVSYLALRRITGRPAATPASTEPANPETLEAARG